MQVEDGGVWLTEQERAELIGGLLFIGSARKRIMAHFGDGNGKMSDFYVKRDTVLDECRRLYRGALAMQKKAKK